MNIVYPEINPSFETKPLNISESEYHAFRSAVHYSSLKNILKSPHAYSWFVRHPKAPTPAMKFGTLAHKAILEGRDFLENYIVEPVFKGLTLDGKTTTSANSLAVKQAKAEWYDQLDTKQLVVSQEEYDRLGFMMDSLVAHPFVQDVFKDGRPEVRGQWLDEETSIGCVFAQDFLSFNFDTQLDVKTCRDSSDWAFAKTVETQKYYLQDAMYAIGAEKVFGKMPRYRAWIAIENCEPWECRVHFVDALYQEVGAFEFAKGMKTLKRCIESGKWPQAQTAVLGLSPSGYFIKQWEDKLKQE